LENINLEQELNTLMQRRLDELKELNEKGVQTFAYSYDIDNYSANIKNNFEQFENKTVKIAGRIMAIRRMGKASFAHIQDNEGKIQFYIKKDDVGDSYDVFKLLDIGDIIGIEGFVFKTKTGEISVHAKSLSLLSKSIRPIPIPKETTDENGNKFVHDQFTDKELRYRQRYLDLILNPESLRK
jgi:lysyl-tRNA synthetase class 2